jgi:hypothetical protein
MRLYLCTCLKVDVQEMSVLNVIFHIHHFCLFREHTLYLEPWSTVRKSLTFLKLASPPRIPAKHLPATRSEERQREIKGGKYCDCVG